jgi:hypothetical protein
MWTAIGQAFSMVFDPYTLMVMVIAALYGLFVGAVPGLTATMATALLVPVTFFMPPFPPLRRWSQLLPWRFFQGIFRVAYCEFQAHPLLRLTQMKLLQ